MPKNIEQNLLFQNHLVMYIYLCMGMGMGQNEVPKNTHFQVESFKKYG